MAPANQLNSATSKAQAIIDFSSHLLQWLSADRPCQTFLIPDVYFRALPLSRSEVSPQECLNLHQHGVQLWSACRKLGRDGIEKEQSAQVAKARSFAYFLLESASSSQTKSATGIIGIFKNALRAAKDCLSYDLLDLGTKIVEILATHHNRLEVVLKGDEASSFKQLHTLRQQYSLLRIALAWKQDRLDLAEHFHATFAASESASDRSSLAGAVDLFYEIGTQQLQTRRNEVALQWLKRACDLLEQSGESANFPEAAEAKLNTMHTYVRALLEISEPESGIEARRVLNVLRSEYSHKLAVTILELEVLSRDPESNLDGYFTELSKVIRTVHIIDSNHKLIMHYIHHLKTLSTMRAIKILKQYILERLARNGNHSWTESAIMILIWTACSEASALPYNSMENDLSDVRQVWNRCLSAEAAHAALMLFWKQIDGSSEQMPKEQIMVWCQVASHELFENAGEVNIAKIQRKLISCHLELSNLVAAQSLFDKMSESTRAQPLSRYLAYCLAIRNGDKAATDSALTAITKVQDKDNRLLFACVGETRKFGSQRQAALLMQRILDKYNYDMPPDIDTCALLRSTARLLMSVLAEDGQQSEEMMLRLCGVSRAAVSHSKKCNGDNSSKLPSFSLQDCLWFERNIYEVAVKQIERWPTKYIIDLLAYSSQVHYPPSQDLNVQQRKLEYLVKTTYAQAVLFATEARNWNLSWTIEDIPRTAYHTKQRPETTEIGWVLYKNVFDSYTRLQGILDELNSRSTSDSPKLQNELLEKIVTVLPLAFEAILFMSPSDTVAGTHCDDLGLSVLIDQASKLAAPSKTYALLADMILSATLSKSSKAEDGFQIPQISLAKASILLGRVINALRNQSEYDVVRAARWIRCVVQVILDGHEYNLGNANVSDPLKIVEEVVDQALSLARPAAEAIVHRNHRQTSNTVQLSSADDDDNDVEMHDAADTDAKDGVPMMAAYPADELEWLATTLFNLAVDFYVAEAEDHARRWTEKAVEVADVLGMLPSIPIHAQAQNGCGDGVGDGGLLARVLREKCALLWLAV